jgi:hypothetical protein
MSLHAEWKLVLYAVTDGDVDLESCLQLFERLTSGAAQTGISKLLIDGRFVSGILSTAERIEIGETLAAYVNQLLPKPRVAVIGHAPTFNGLAVSIARKLDFDVELFESVPDALAWLRRDKPLGASAGAG